MPTVTVTGSAVHADPQHNHLGDELQAFLEAFTLLEFGALPKELSKIA